MSTTRVTTVAHPDLTTRELRAMRALFDAEYLHDVGEWDPDLPYGYAPHDVHVLAWEGSRLAGHVGWAERVISVGDHAVTIAGVGGVLVAAGARGTGLGQRLMAAAAASMRAHGGPEFGYLGCDESVLPFYESCGWRRVVAPERWVDRQGRDVAAAAGPPLLVLPLRPGGGSWPDGVIDLRGRAW